MADERGPVEPTIAIAPPGWFAWVARAGALAAAALGIAGAVARGGEGRPGAAAACVVCGALSAMMSADVAGRWVRSAGPVLRVHQWFRTVELSRDDIDEFAAARASLVRWDIVAERDERPDLRLWATRMLPAGRRTRQRWLEELEAWRTWRGGPTGGA